ncbi:MAG: amidohydrolase [Chloroflexi bacterium]|nr:amidohydrolase [Chloroflexota bacterium]
MDYTVISADTHLDLTWLPGDMFMQAAPDGIKDKMPHVRETDKGKRWIIEGEDIARAGGFSEYVPGEYHHLDRMAEAGFYSGVQEGIYRPAVAELRIEDQDRDQVNAEVIYGILGIAGGGFSGPGFKDPKVTTAIYDVYNEWIADFVKAHPQRLGGLACVVSHDPQIAARQVRRAAEIGLKGAEINVGKATKPIYHRDWDPLWAAAAECHMPISFHTLGLNYREPDPSELKDYKYIDLGLQFILFQLSGAEFVVSITLSGACERHPDFRFVLGECGIGWLPYVLERTDIEYDDRLFHLGLKLKPTEYWRRQGYSTFQQEYVSMDEIDRIGVDNIMWGSDYPHPDGVYPDSQKAIQEGMGHLQEDVRRKIVCDNAARLYSFN